MKRSMKIVSVALVILANIGFLFGQQTRVELGDKYFDQFAFKKAIKLYEGIKDSEKNWDIYAKLGDCYYNTSKPNKAIDNYRLALKEKSYNMDHYRLKYVLSMLSVEPCDSVIDFLIKDNDSKTMIVMAKYFGIELSDNKIPDDFQTQICQKSNRTDLEVEWENLTKYSLNSDFGGFISNNSDTLYFTSSRENPAKSKRFNKRLYKWNSQPYLDIYEGIVVKNTDSSYLRLVAADSSKIDNSINTVAHQSTIAITNDGKQMYFSSGEVKENNKNKLKYDRRGTSSLKLQRATLINNKWVITNKDRVAMKFFDFKNYSIGSPALSPDNKRLYFVSCAPFPDAIGQTDIYYSNIKEDGTFDSIVNLGDKINTAGREMFPFISKDSILYFSSDGVYNGKLSNGLLDIYKYDLKSKDSVISLGEPFNSNKDDFAYFVRSMPDSSGYSEQGFFSSNREKLIQEGDKIIPMSDDDIYSFHIKRNSFQTIQVVVRDASTQNILENALVEVFNSEGKPIKAVHVDSSGTINFEVENDQNYTIRGSKSMYKDKLVENISSDAGKIDLALKSIPCTIPVDQIIFDPNSDSINFEAKVALIPVWEFLLTNPEIQIRIESHTDTKGSVESNMDLSDRRAVNTRNYLLSIEGVMGSQIVSAKGFGETCPINSDEKIRSLSSYREKEDAHRENRRSRFIIENCSDGTEGCSENNSGD